MSASSPYQQGHQAALGQPLTTVTGRADAADDVLALLPEENP